MVEGRNASGRFIRYAWAVNGVAVGSGGVTAAADGSSCVFDWVVPAPGTASSYTVTVTLDDGYAPVSSYSFPVMTPPPPLYWRSGVQTDLPVASLAGWTQCFSDTYKDDGTPLASIFSACAGAKLVMACRPVGSDTLTVAAMGARSDVLFETGYADASTTHEANGVAWYFDDNYSWGFANAGDTVQKTACDMEQSSDPEHRLCWHTGLGAPGELRFGWRCGSTVWLNGFPAPYADATTWERIIFTAP